MKQKTIYYRYTKNWESHNLLFNKDRKTIPTFLFSCVWLMLWHKNGCGCKLTWKNNPVNTEVISLFVVLHLAFKTWPWTIVTWFNEIALVSRSRGGGGGRLCRFCLNFFHLLARKPNLEFFSIYSNKFFHNFHSSESSFTCPGLRARGLVWRLLMVFQQYFSYIGENRRVPRENHRPVASHWQNFIT